MQENTSGCFFSEHRVYEQIIAEDHFSDISLHYSIDCTVEA